MRRLRLVPLALLLLPGVAWAQIDPGPNGIGIYFDQQATRTALTISPVTEQTVVQAWVVATNLPVGQSVVRWAGSILATNGAVDALPPTCGHYVWGGHTFGHNYVMNMCCSWGFGWDVWGAPEEAIPVGAATILGGVTVALQGCQEPVYLYLAPTDVSLVGVPGEFTLNPSSGAWNRPLAVINGPAPVATEPESWGHLKSLYR